MVSDLNIMTQDTSRETSTGILDGLDEETNENTYGSFIKDWLINHLTNYFFDLFQYVFKHTSISVSVHNTEILLYKSRQPQVPGLPLGLFLFKKKRKRICFSRLEWVNGEREERHGCTPGFSPDSSLCTFHETLQWTSVVDSFTTEETGDGHISWH